MNIFPVIIAGGVGTRFWPLSREKKPKQFLPIISQKTMIEETVYRLLPEIPYSNIQTVASFEQTQIIKKLLPGIPQRNLIIEPQGKNTAPSLILATAKIFLENSKAVVAALPADHLIKNPSLFLKKLMSGAAVAERGEFLITFGIPPSFPATGYGYIQFSEKKTSIEQDEIFYSVLEFKEKPDASQAIEFLKTGNTFWNSGMFIWQAEVFAKKLQQYSPHLFGYWEKILAALENKDEPLISAIFEEIPSISIDYALMEKAKGVLMCTGDFGWSDAGAWSSLADIWEKDKRGNALRGESIAIDSKDCVVYNPGKLTALVGVEDTIIVDTPDVLLVCRKDQDQKVKEIVETIKKKGKTEFL